METGIAKAILTKNKVRRFAHHVRSYYKATVIHSVLV